RSRRSARHSAGHRRVALEARPRRNRSQGRPLPSAHAPHRSHAMSEPKRWMDEAPPEAVEQLLHAASAERPPEAPMSRTLTALGLGAGATSAATTAAATMAGASATGAVSAGKATGVLAASALVKWGLVGGAPVAASVGGTVVVKRAGSHGLGR